MLSFFPRGVLDEILNLIESVSEDFPSYSYISSILVRVLARNFKMGVRDSLLGATWRSQNGIYAYMHRNIRSHGLTGPYLKLAGPSAMSEI